MNQLLLFDSTGQSPGGHRGKDPNAAPPGAACRMARSRDPRTSHLAASYVSTSGTAARWQRVALRLIRRRPGMTARELEKLAGCENGQIRKRLLEVMRAGHITRGTARQCSVSHRQAATWWPV